MRTEQYSRRTVFTSAAALVAALVAALAPSPSLAQTQGKPSTFKPAAHPQDGWSTPCPKLTSSLTPSSRWFPPVSLPSTARRNTATRCWPRSERAVTL